MNRYETMIQAELENMQTRPGEGLRERILTDAAVGAVPAAPRRSVRGRTVLISAVIAALMTTTVLAYGNVLRELVFGDSRAAQVETVYNPNRGGIRTGVVYQPWRISVYDQNGVDQMGEFVSHSRLYESDWWLEMLGRAETERLGLVPDVETAYYAPFAIRKPAYLPENTELADIWIAHGQRGDAIMLYFVNRAGIGHGSIALTLFYVGSGGYFEIETTDIFDEVMVGDVNALRMDIPILVQPSFYDETSEYTIQHLIWAADDYVYVLTNTYGPTMERVYDLVAIAESIG